jgi:hypothetical protein
MLLIFGVFLCFLLGFLILVFWKDDFRFGERLFLSFPLGLGISTLIMFIQGRLNIPLDGKRILFILVGIVSFLFILAIIKRRFSFWGLRDFFIWEKIFKMFKVKKISKLEIILIFLLFFLVCWSFLVTFTWPVITWDALSLYDFRAKRFFEAHSLAESILTRGTREQISYNYSYPFFTSLAHAFVYFIGGSNPKFIYSLAYLSLIGSFYFVLRRKVSRTISLFFTAILATDKEFLYHSTIAYTNLYFALFLGIGSIHLLQWQENNKNGQLILSALFSGLAVWTRSQEPLWIAPLVFLLVYGVLRRKLLPLIFYFSTVLSFRQLWESYRSHIFESLGGAHLYLLKTSFYFDLTKISLSFFYAIKTFLVNNKVSFAFFILALFLVVIKKEMRKYLHILILMFLFIVIVWGGTYFFSLNFSWWNKIPGSIIRMSMFFQILIFYFAAVAFFQGAGRNISFRLPEIKFKI